MVISGEIRPRAQYFDKMLKFRKTSLKFAHISQNIRKKSLKFCTCFENFAKHSQSAHILMTISVKFRNLLPKCYQNANICKISLNFRWLCYRNPKFCWYQDRNAGMQLYFVEKVVIYRRIFGEVKSPEKNPYPEKHFAKYTCRLWSSGTPLTRCTWYVNSPSRHNLSTEMRLCGGYYCGGPPFSR